MNFQYKLILKNVIFKGVYKITWSNDLINTFYFHLCFSSRLLKTESRKSESSLEYLRTQVRSLEKARDQALADNKWASYYVTKLFCFCVNRTYLIHISSKFDEFLNVKQVSSSNIVGPRHSICLTNVLLTNINNSHLHKIFTILNIVASFYKKIFWKKFWKKFAHCLSYCVFHLLTLLAVCLKLDISNLKILI